MKLSKSCEVEACHRDDEGSFAVLDLFNVDLCDAHAKRLRDAMFLDEKITTALETLRGCQTMLQVCIRNVHRAADNDAIMRLTHIEETITTARADVYKAVMEWLQKESKT